MRRVEELKINELAQRQQIDDVTQMLHEKEAVELQLREAVEALSRDLQGIVRSQVGLFQ